MNFFESVETLKSELREKDLYRQLNPPRGIDFCSNDYLGLAHNREFKTRLNKALSQCDLGSTGSRLLRGHSVSIENLEKHLAAFCGSEEALFFPSGYQANLGLFSCLLKLNAAVFSDEQIHASIIDGIRLSGCEKYIFSHNSLEDLEMLLKQKAKFEKLNVVVTESVFSMSGSRAPLVEMLELCDRYGAYLVVDEAHATGLYGERGSGLVEEMGLTSRVLGTVHTAGKSLGVSGAWIAGSQTLKELLINQSRPFIYSTAPAHYQRLPLSVVLEFLAERGQSLKKQFIAEVNGFQEKVFALGNRSGFVVLGRGSPVTSLILKENKKVLSFMETMARHGFDVRAIRPPTVSEGQALIRITHPLSRTGEETESFLQALSQTLEGLK